MKKKVIQNRSYQRKPSSWDAGEIMMLIVVAYVEREQIQRSVVRIGLMALEEHVMLSNKVSRDGMKTHSQHRASQHVEQRLGAQQPVEKNVECKLDSRVK